MFSLWGGDCADVFTVGWDCADVFTVGWELC